MGTDKGEVQIWDAVKTKRIRTMAGHKQRVGCTAWSHHMLATGSRDRSILLRDVRQQDPFTLKLAGHRSEVGGSGGVEGKGSGGWGAGLAKVRKRRGPGSVSLVRRGGRRGERRAAAR